MIKAKGRASPLELEREKGSRLSEMLTTVVADVQQLEKQKKDLEAQVIELIGSADVAALAQVSRLQAQADHLAAEIVRKGTTRAGIEQSLAASASAVGVLEQERDKEILEAQGRELIDVRRDLFQKFRDFAGGFAAEIQAIEKPHHEHQDLREKTFGTPEGKARRELDHLRGLVRVLTEAIRGAP